MQQREVLGTSKSNDDRRRTFFRSLFREGTGYLCIALKQSDHNSMSESYFKYPLELEEALSFINKNYFGRTVYFCAQLLKAPKRNKDNVVDGQQIYAAWADVDAADPAVLKPECSILVESSPGRYHGYWRLKEPVTAAVAEDISKRIAYYYAAYGVDKKGWDLSQLLRVPLTYNTKYPDAPIVKVISANSNLYTVEDFAHLPPVAGSEFLHTPMPVMNGLRSEDILQKYADKLDGRATLLLETLPPESASWSEPLWNLECLLLEAGMSKEEAFVVAWGAACNKYERDNRNELGLWQEICKAEIVLEERHISAQPNKTIEVKPLLNISQRRGVSGDSFVDRFIKWASTRTDAPQQYHVAGAFTILSTFLAGKVELPRRSGTLKLNTWFMLLGSTTIDRKSTSMNMAMDLIETLDPNAKLATDGSLEGLVVSLQTRPGRPSIFHVDEFSGLLAKISRRDYMAGMLEMLTFLYDGSPYKRRLAREVIDVKNPCLIMLCGGIRNSIIDTLDASHVRSGFLPRFIIVDSQDAPKEIMDDGPPTADQGDSRNALLQELTDLMDRYRRMTTLGTKDGPRMEMALPWEARLTTEAWQRYNEMSKELANEAVNSVHPDLFSPMLTRLGNSIQKCAALLAAARQDPHEKGYVEVDVADLEKAMLYGESWRENACYMVENVEDSPVERRIMMCFHAIARAGEKGILRSDLMRNFKLNKRDTDLIMETLRERGLITGINLDGKRGVKYFDVVFRPP